MCRALIVDQIDLLSPKPSGIETIIRDLLKYGMNGSEPPFVVGATRSQDYKLGVIRRLSIEGRDVDFLAVCRIGHRSTWARLPDSARLVLGLIMFKRLVPKAVVPHCHRVEVALAVLVILLKRPVLYIHNNAESLAGKESESIWRFFSYFYRVLERGAVAHARTVVMFNKTGSERIRRIRRTLHTQQTWFDPDVFWPRETAQIIGPLKVIWVGRFEKQKDPILALRVAAEATRMGIDYRIAFIGDGSLREVMMKYIFDNDLSSFVEIMGSRSKSEVSVLMRAADVLLITSHFEGSPTVLAEAGGSGIPIIGTEEADPDSVISSGVNGERICGRSAASLAAGFLQVGKYKVEDCTSAVAERAAPIAIATLREVTG